MFFDLIILLLLCAGAFALGWFSHRNFGTTDAMIDAGANKLKGWANKAPPPAPGPTEKKNGGDL